MQQEEQVSYCTSTYVFLVIDQGQDSWILAKFFIFAHLWTKMELGPSTFQKKNKVNIKPSRPNKLDQ